MLGEPIRPVFPSGLKEGVMIEDWIANTYGGLSRREFLAGISVAGFSLAGFAMAATPVAGEIIHTSSQDLATAEHKISSGDFQVPIYEARPAAAGRYPVILIIPEVFGMHEHIKDVTRRFAREGFLAVTFEPYAREGGVLHLPDIGSIRKVVDRVPDDRVMGDLESLVAYVKQHPGVQADRIGLTGFCRGGMYSLLFSARNREIKAAVAWYGQLRPAKTPGVRTEGPLDVADRIMAPVLGLYGEADLGIPTTDVAAMEKALTTIGRRAEFILYPGAPHAFFADYRPSYRPEAAKDAWKRCLDWFNTYLKQ